MFLEKSHSDNSASGWIEVICGSMFSGKTEELIRRLRRAEIANQQVAIFKPLVDNRYSDELIVSHDNNSVTSIAVAHAIEIVSIVKSASVIGIDEAQFFEDDLVDVCTKLANEGSRLIVAGLDTDYLGKPFGPIPKLMAIAEFVTKVHAICVDCGHLAQYSYRLVPGEGQILIGATKEYKPLCRSCYNKKQMKGR